jgi:hypothetical protein
LRIDDPKGHAQLLAMVVRSSTVVERGPSLLLGPDDRRPGRKTGRRFQPRTCGSVASATRSS